MGRLFWWAGLGFGLVAFGCGDLGGGAGGNGAGGYGGEGGSSALGGCGGYGGGGGFGANGGAVTACDPYDGGQAGGPAADPTCQDKWFAEASGLVRDDACAPAGNALITLCIRQDISNPDEAVFCVTPAGTLVDGTFTIAVPEAHRCMQAAALRIFVTPPTTASTFCEVEFPPLGTELKLPAYKMFDTDPPAILPPKKDGCLNADTKRTVTFADGMEMDVVPSDFFGTYADLEAKALAPETPGFCFGEVANQFTKVYAMRPEGDLRPGKSFDLRIPNSEGLPAGAAVKLWILGGLNYRLASGTPVQEAQWVHYATARVDDEGEKIVGGALPFVNWFAYGP